MNSLQVLEDVCQEMTVVQVTPLLDNMSNKILNETENTNAL